MSLAVMRKKYKSLAFLISFPIFLNLSFVYAQTYESIVVGGAYLCGKFPDGTTQIVENSNGSYNVVDLAVANKNIAKQLSAARKRVTKLSEAKRNLNEEDKSKAALGVFRKTFAELQNGGDLDPNRPIPKTRKELKAVVSELLKISKGKVSYFETYRDGLQNCKDNLQKGSQGTVPFRVVYIQDGPYPVVAVVIFQPVSATGAQKKFKYPQYAFCIRPASAGVGSGRGTILTPNPCTLLDINKDCSSSFDKDYVQSFFTRTQFYGGASIETIQAKISQYQAEFAAGFVGRRQGDGLDNHSVTYNDECNDF